MNLQTLKHNAYKGICCWVYSVKLNGMNDYIMKRFKNRLRKELRCLIITKN